jgi:hypothetical protein
MLEWDTLPALAAADAHQIGAQGAGQGLDLD